MYYGWMDGWMGKGVLAQYSTLQLVLTYRIASLCYRCYPTCLRSFINVMRWRLRTTVCGPLSGMRISAAAASVSRSWFCELKVCPCSQQLYLDDDGSYDVRPILGLASEQLWAWPL